MRRIVRPTFTSSKGARPSVRRVSSRAPWTTASSSRRARRTEPGADGVGGPAARLGKGVRHLRRVWGVFRQQPRAIWWTFAALHAAVFVALTPLMLRGGAEGDLPLYQIGRAHV